jgi:hypothetical protein
MGAYEIDSFIYEKFYTCAATGELKTLISPLYKFYMENFSVAMLILLILMRNPLLP